MRSASDIKEEKTLLYVPPKVRPERATFPELTEEKIAAIEQELKNPQNPVVIQYIKTHLGGNPYGRYNKKLFDTPYGLIYGKKGLYAIYNENDDDEDNQQFEAAPEGSFGKIKLIKHLHTNEWLILKTQIIKSPLKSDKENYEDKKSYKNEHAILSKLELTEEPIMQRRSSKNPDIIKGFLVMKYLKGQDLFDLIIQKINKTSPLSHWADLFWLHVCIRITEALIKVNKKMILHGDIKFENILFDIVTDKAHVIDFGSSHEAKSVKMTRACIPGFNAPENFKSDYDEKSEVFAFSNILEAFLRNNIPYVVIREKARYLPLNAPPTFKLMFKKTIFYHNEKVTSFLEKMRHPKKDERPTLEKILAFLNETFQEYASNPSYNNDIDTIQQIFSKSRELEKIRLEKIHKRMEDTKSSKQKTLLSLLGIFKDLSINSHTDIQTAEPITPTYF